MAMTSSKSDQTSSQADSRVGASDEAIAVGGEASIVVNADAPEAYDLAEMAVDSAGDVAVRTLDTATDFLNKNFEFFTDVQENSNVNFQKTIDALDANSRDDQTTITSQLIKAALPLGAVYLALKVFKK